MHFQHLCLTPHSHHVHATPLSAAVLDDIASTMLNRRFIEELFLKHQPLHSPSVLRMIFDKLAHASIMRLNTQSMDKVTRSTTRNFPTMRPFCGNT